MAECVCLSGCLFFNDNMASMPATAELLKARFCRGDSTGCARFMVFSRLGREGVPADLYPTQTDRAQQMLALRP